MRALFILGQVVVLALCISAASADRGGRGGGGRLPNGGGNFERRDDRINWNDYQVAPGNQNQVVVVEDGQAAEARRKADEKKKAEIRKKAVTSHGDPMGGFFDEKQDPKNMFDN